MGEIWAWQLWMLHPSQPLPRILHLSYPRVSVLPQVEEFFVVLNGLTFKVFLFIDFAEHVEGFGVDVAIVKPTSREGDNLLIFFSSP